LDVSAAAHPAPYWIAESASSMRMRRGAVDMETEEEESK
jgi:hypothetical protein